MGEGVPAIGGKRTRIGVAATPQQLGLSLPPLKIIHAVKSREQAAAGAMPGTWEYKRRNLGPTVDVIFLSQKNIRVYQVRDGEKVQTRCASSDGIVPIPDAPVRQADHCQTCPRSVWNDLYKDGKPVLRSDGSGRVKQTPPDCNSGFAFLGIMTEDSPFPASPFWFVCRGTAEKPAREFLKEWDSQQMSALFEWRVRLSLEEDRSGGLVWYLPAFSVVETYPLEKFLPAYQAAAEIEYVHFIGRDVVEDDEQPARDVTPPRGGGGQAVGYRDDVPPPSDEDFGL